MTIKEAAESLRKVVEGGKFWLKYRTLFVSKEKKEELKFAMERDELAIRSLEAWEKVLDEFMEEANYEPKDEVDYAYRCALKDGIKIINRHLSEVEGKK